MATGDPYITADELAGYLRMDNGAAADGDDLLDVSVRSASEWINSWCRRDFNLADTATARYFDVSRDGMVLVDDIGHATITVATDTANDGTYATTWDSTDVQVLPLGSLDAGEPVMSLRPVGSYRFPIPSTRTGMVQVTARWGWPTVPYAVRQACRIQAARLYRRHESPEGVLGGGDFGLVRVGSRLDPDVELLLAPYRLLLVG